MGNFIYLDNNSTTPIDPRVLDAMMPFLKDQFANASSQHFMGLKIKTAVEKARTQLAELINSESKQLLFTSGATEAINLALKGMTFHSDKKHIVTSQTEHKAVLDTCKYLETIGFEVTYLPVKKDGLLELEVLKNAIRKDTLLVCIMWVNNETGVIQDIPAISKICLDNEVMFMTDATQAVGKLPVDVSELKIDFLALSGHKFYAPKGIGALYYSPNAKKYLSPLIHGGGHEDGLRSGTLNTAAIVGIGRAAEMAKEEIFENNSTIGKLRDTLETELLQLDGAFVNGNNHRLYNVINICIPRLESDFLIGRLQNIALSSGSACASSVMEPSHVLKAMGLNDNQANCSYRFSLGKFNSENEIKQASEQIKQFYLQHD